MGQKIFQIAVDGPSGTGKSTIAKNVAKKLGIEYIDTGAMYRAVGLKMHRLGIPMEETQPLLTMLADTDIDFSDEHIFLDGEDVSELIRTQEISKAASDCSAFASVRRKLVDLQQKMAKSKSVIMDGRDIGTVILPEAEVKIFLFASNTERAKRRYEELRAKGQTVRYEDVLADMTKRDENDRTRATAPAVAAKDAVLLDNSGFEPEQTLKKAIEIIDGKLKKQ